MLFNDFGSNFLLVGLSSTEKDDKKKVYLHFLFKLKNGSGYGCFRTSSEASRLYKIIPESDLHVGSVYSVTTDKFLNEKKELITYLKDVSFVRSEP